MVISNFIHFLYCFKNHFYLVLNEAELLMDGCKVLVNQDFCTSDSNIFAAGTFIKHVSEPNHQYTYVSAIEMAEKV